MTFPVRCMTFPVRCMTFPVRDEPFVTQMRRGRLPAGSCRHHPMDGPERPSGRNASPGGITPSNIMSPPRNQPGSWSEVRLGARAHTTPHHQPRARTTRPPAVHLTTLDSALDAGAPAQVRIQIGAA
jgi:hypothetical protein